MAEKGHVKIEKTSLKGVFLIKPDSFIDFRGSYTEIYNKEVYNKLFEKYGLPKIEFLTGCVSRSKKGVLRGFHGDAKTWKLTACLNGLIYSIILNCNENSEEFGKWEAFILSDQNKYQLLIPPKFGNSFLILSEIADYYYKQSTYYNPKNLPQFTYKWNDPRFKFVWPIDKPILSKRDE